MAAAPGRQVVTIGLSGQMHGVVVCDRALEPLRPAVLWSDRRAEPYLPKLRAELDAALGGDALAHLANPTVAGMTGPTIAALHRDEPDLMQQAAAVMQPKDWVRHRLSGQWATDPSDASATLLWDAAEDRWSDEACQVFGVSSSWLPPVRHSAERAGALTSDAAEVLGLTPGVPIAVGAADTAAALLGAGIEIGETQVSTGTGGQIAQLCDKLRIDRSGKTHLFRAATTDQGGPNRWYAMAAMQNVGIAIDWAMNLLQATQEEIINAMTGWTRGSASAGDSETGVSFRPYLTGERTPHMDASLTGRWDGLRPSTDRADLIRSVFFGVATAMADGKTALAAAGYRIDAALLAGGGSTAPWWRQLLADQLAIPLVPHDAIDASVRGAGLLGWAAVGHSVDPAATVARSAPIKPQLDH